MAEFKRIIGSGYHTYKSPVGNTYQNKRDMVFTVTDSRDVEWFREQDKRYIELTPAKKVTDKAEKAAEIITEKVIKPAQEKGKKLKKFFRGDY